MDIIQLILAIAGGVSIIGGAGAVIWRWLRPALKLVKRVSELEAHDKKDYAAVTEIKETNRMLCKGIIVLLENAATGNSVEKIKSVKTEIQEYLIQAM